MRAGGVDQSSDLTRSVPDDAPGCWRHRELARALLGPGPGPVQVHENCGRSFGSIFKQSVGYRCAHPPCEPYARSWHGGAVARAMAALGTVGRRGIHDGGIFTSIFNNSMGNESQTMCLARTGARKTQWPVSRPTERWKGERATCGMEQDRCLWDIVAVTTL